jgi:C1A family cysteine protease
MLSATCPLLVVVFALVSAIVSATGNIPASYASLSSSEQKELFEQFKLKYGKTYSDHKTEKNKYNSFLSALQDADQRNEDERKAGGTAIHGITSFSDLSKKEFSKLYLSGFAQPPEDVIKSKQYAKVRKYKGASTSVDWSGVYTTPVNNQGHCGACWAFSVTQQIESDSIRNGLLTTSDPLSTEQILAW